MLRKLILVVVIIMMTIWLSLHVRKQQKVTEGFNAFPTSYEDRLRYLCTTGYRNSGYTSPEECLSANAALFTEAPLREAYERVIGDDSVFACMVQNIKLGKDMNDCVRSFLVLHEDVQQALQKAEDRSSTDTYSDRMIQLCGDKPQVQCEAILPGGLGNTQAWRDFVQTDAVYQALQKAVVQGRASLDVAVLQVMQAEKDAAEKFKMAAFPISSTSRETALPDEIISLGYEDRVRLLCERGYKMIAATFTNPEDCKRSKVTDMMLNDPVFRNIFEKVVMDNQVYGCLINNMDKDGDGLFCLVNYFHNHPDDFMALKDAAAKYESNIGRQSHGSTAAVDRIRDILSLEGCQVLTETWKSEREALQTRQTIEQQTKSSCEAITDEVGDALLTAIVKAVPDRAMQVDSVKADFKAYFAEETKTLCSRTDLASSILLQADQVCTDMCKTGGKQSQAVLKDARVQLPKVLQNQASSMSTTDKSANAAVIKRYEPEIFAVLKHLDMQDVTVMSSMLSEKEHTKYKNLDGVATSTGVDEIELHLLRTFSVYNPGVVSVIDSKLIPLIRKMVKDIKPTYEKLWSLALSAITFAKDQINKRSGDAGSTFDWTADNGVCNMINLNLSTNPDGQVILRWQSRFDSQPGAPKVFRDMKTFDRWWAFIEKNIPSMSHCRDALQAGRRACTSPYVTKPNMTTPGAVDSQSMTSACALMPNTPCIATDSALKKDTNEIAAADAQVKQLKAQIEASKKLTNDLQTGCAQTVGRYRAALETDQAELARLKDLQKKFGFVYLPEDKWYPLRPPICLTDRPAQVQPFEDRYPPNLMQLDMWS